MRAAVVFQSPLRAKTMRGLCIWAGTRAALRLREQLAAPSNIHERDGKTMKDSVDPGIQKIEAETASVNSQRLMGLICIKSELLLFLRGRCLCARGGSRWAAIEFLSPVMLLFCPVCSSCPIQYNWEILAASTGLSSGYSELHKCLLMGKSNPKVQVRAPVILLIVCSVTKHYHAHINER